LRNVPQDLQCVDGADAAAAVDVAPEGGVVIADLGAGLVLGDAELGDVAELFEGIDGGYVAVAVDVTLGEAIGAL
jgi:hypothetical protein